MSKVLVSEKEIKCSNIKNNIKMINFNNITKENIKEHNPSWQQIPDHSCRILIIWVSKAEKANSFFNLISVQLNINLRK